MTLSEKQVETLLRPIHPGRVMHRDGHSHLPGWDVTAHLNRLFGFDGWDKTILSIEQIDEYKADPKTDNGKTGWYVTYRCCMRLTVWGAGGGRPTIREDGACGTANNQPVKADAHDLAYKNAITYALKRCAKDWGDQFGLALYNKGQITSLVGTTLVGGNDAAPDRVDESAPVPLTLGDEDGRDDEPTAEPADAEPATQPVEQPPRTVPEPEPAPTTQAPIKVAAKKAPAKKAAAPKAAAPAPAATPIAAKRYPVPEGTPEVDKDAVAGGWENEQQRHDVHSRIHPILKTMVEQDTISKDDANSLYGLFVKPYIPLTVDQYNAWLDATEAAKVVHKSAKEVSEKFPGAVVQ